VVSESEITASPVAETSSATRRTTPEVKPLELAQEGKEFYEAGNLDRAIRSWQQAAAAYAAAGDQVGSRESYLNTATAQQTLGLYAQSCKSLLAAFNLNSSTSCTSILQQAQEIEPQLTTTGQQPSISAIANLTKEPNSIDKATALLRFGDYLRESGYPKVAVQTLKSSLATAQEMNQPTQESAALLSLGNTERAIAQRQQNQFSPQTVALDIVANAGGSSDAALVSYQPAIKYYQQAATKAPDQLDRMKAELNHLSLLLDIQEFWHSAIAELKHNLGRLDITDKAFLQYIGENATSLGYELDNTLNPQIAVLTQEIDPKIADLPLSRSSIYAEINFAQSLIRQGRKDKNTAQILGDAIAQSRQLKNITTETEALGYLGYLYEQQEQYSEAQRLTEASLKLVPNTEYPEIAYRWNAQLGRIMTKQNNIDDALVAYEASFNTIKALRSDLATTPVEPILREYISLLLTEKSEPSPQKLNQARDVLESLQITKLDNFFRDPCSEVAEDPVIIDKVDPQAAVIYPILLPKRLEVILTLPGKPLRHYTTDSVDRDTIENTIEELRRRSLTNPGFAEAIRGARGGQEQQIQIRQIQKSQEESLQQDILPSASKLYNWLIAPAEADLKESQVKTLVFVLDGVLRNIPMAVLYDEKNQEYLIEKDYNIALSSGLQLTAPEPLKRQPIKVLAAGVTKDFPQYRFSAIPKVKDELQQIKSIFGQSEILLNKEFTKDSLQQKLQESDFPIVHLATHGQFGSTSEQTFILSGEESEDPLINVNQFDNLLRVSSLRRSQPIELLVLSACNTAEGDNQAILGLAGVAVRAGARSTLATLWGANDDATANLMTRFYQNLAEDETVSKAKALREAQLSLFKTDDGQYRHPYYWAPFVLIGNWL
jgi:CHAT domain-containing protein